MSPLSGAQDLWVAGARVYFKRDPVNAVEQPIIDLGTVVSANPTFDIETLDCIETDGGCKTLLSRVTSQVIESYDVELKNFSPDNQALLWFANNPEAFTQSATPFDYEQFAHVGRLLKLLDGDSGSFIYGVDKVIGVAESEANSGAPAAIESITTQVVKVTGDVTGYVSNGDSIILYGLDVPAEDGVFTVNGAPTYNTGTDDTDITVTEAITDQGGAGGTMVPQAFTKDTDWEDVNLERGLIRIIKGGAIAADQTVTVVVLPNAITDADGLRLVKPQSQEGQIEGQVMIVYGRECNARQSVREAKAQISPSASNITPDEFSTMTLQITVLTDETADPQEGRLLNWLGDTPALS